MTFMNIIYIWPHWF